MSSNGSSLTISTINNVGGETQRNLIRRPRNNRTHQDTSSQIIASIPARQTTNDSLVNDFFNGFHSEYPTRRQRNTRIPRRHPRLSPINNLNNRDTLSQII